MPRKTFLYPEPVAFDVKADSLVSDLLDIRTRYEKEQHYLISGGRGKRNTLLIEQNFTPQMKEWEGFATPSFGFRSLQHKGPLHLFMRFSSFTVRRFPKLLELNVLQTSIRSS